MMVIYKITNTINGKIYVGLDTKNNDNYFGSGLYIRKAIKKYGKENFNRQVIDKAENFNELCLKEKYWIDKLDTIYPNGYNLTKGGVGSYGRIVSEETRNKIGKSKIGNKNCVGRILSEKSKLKMSKAKKDFKPNLNVIKAVSKNANKMWKDLEYRNKTLSNLHKKVKCEFCGFESNVGNITIHKRKYHKI